MSSGHSLGFEVFELDGLDVFPAADASCPRYLRQRILVGRREVDHEENPVRQVWAGAVEALCVPGERRQDLRVALRVLQVQRDDVGQSELALPESSVKKDKRYTEHEERYEREDHVQDKLKFPVIFARNLIPVVTL